MTKIRILTDIVGNSTEYTPGQVVSVEDGVAASFITAGYAIAEGPSPSGIIATAYANAGYIEVIPDPSGYIQPDPSGLHINDVPAGGAYYFTDEYTFHVVFPGRRESTFDLLRLRP